MAYRRFEELPVWNDAIGLAIHVLRMSESGAFLTAAGLKNQMERAAISVSNNIAEGFERGTNGERVTFLYIAKGSVAEVRSMLCLLERLDPETDLTDRIGLVKRRTESISRQLCGWIESIKDSGFEGNRSRTPEHRRLDEQSRRRDDFLSQLRDVQERAKPPSRTDLPPD